jgi:hypothetical protein
MRIDIFLCVCGGFWHVAMKIGKEGRGSGRRLAEAVEGVREMRIRPI